MGLVGKNVSELDTPTLWVDLNGMEGNIQHFSQYFQAAGVAWRPHIKGIKIPAIAHQMIRAGAIGVTCAKVTEAEVMVAGGIQDVLVANEVVGESKIIRLVALNRAAHVMVAVDNIENAKQIAEIAYRQDLEVDVLAEINTGMNRCGVEPGEAAQAFCAELTELAGIHLAGLMSWEGHVVKIEDPQQKRSETQRAVGSLVETAERCRKGGIPISIVSCGGTGSYTITAHIHGVTEMQAGGGVLGDVTYEKWGAQIRPSLFILSTVTSHPCPDRAVIDAGRKAMNVEYSLPQVIDQEGVELARCTAEHGILRLDPAAAKLRVGDRINLAAGYEDLTVFLHDQLIGVRAGRVEAVWDIQARGKLV